MSSDSFNERIRSALARLTITHRRRVRRCVEMISTTEIKISVVIREADLEKAVRSLHSTFDLE
jgi:aspartokinase